MSSSMGRIIPYIKHDYIWLPSGKLSQNYGKSPFLMGKSTISVAMFNSFLYVYQLWLLMNYRLKRPSQSMDVLGGDHRQAGNVHNAMDCDIVKTTN